MRHWQAARAAGRDYQPVVDRAGAWLDVVGWEWFPLASRAQFQSQQNVLSDRLFALLERGLGTARRLGARRSPGEQLQLVVWLADSEGKFLTAWGHSDRAHRDPRTVEPVPIEADSNWVAVRAFCQGTTFERDRDVYASRWKYVRGIPLILEQPTRLPVGCISIASTLPGRRTVLKRMAEPVRAAFNGFLAAGTLDLLLPGRPMRSSGRRLPRGIEFTQMAPTHREIVSDVGDGWAVVWDATEVPKDVRSAFESARDEQRAENAAVNSDEQDGSADSAADS